MAVGPYSTLDLELLDSRLTYKMFLKDLKNALFDDGYFVLEGKSVEGLQKFSNACNEFFTTPEDMRMKVEMDQGFRGYCPTTKELVFSGFDRNEFDDDILLNGKNQYPDIQGFKSAFSDISQSMKELGDQIVSNLCGEALGEKSPTQLFEGIWDSPEKESRLRIFKSGSESNTTDGTKMGFMSFLMCLENDSPSLVEVTRKSGDNILVEVNPDQLLVVVEETACRLTKGLFESCKAYNVVNNSLSAVYTQCVSLDFQFKNFVFPKRIFVQNSKSGEQKFEDDYFTDFGTSVLVQHVNRYTFAGKKYHESHIIVQSATSNEDLPVKVQNLVALQKSIDNAILMHTISSSAPLTLSQLSSIVALESKMTAATTYIQQILTIWPKAYKLSPCLIKTNELCIEIPSLEESLIKQIPVRTSHFESLSLAYARTHSCESIPLHPITSAPRTVTLSPVHLKHSSPKLNRFHRSSPYASPTRSPMKALHGSPSRLNRLSGSPNVSPTKKEGTFMERIRAKEAMLKKQQFDPILQHQKYIESKLESVASIVANLRKSKGTTTMSLPQIVDKIQDSMMLRISKSECEECLTKLCEKIPELVEIRKAGNMSGVWIKGDLSVGDIRSRLTVSV